MQDEDDLSDWYGEADRVTSGCLDLRGQLKPITLFWNDDEEMEPGLREWEAIIDLLHSRRGVQFSISFDVPTSNPLSFENDNAQARLFYMPRCLFSRSKYDVASTCTATAC